MSQSSAHPGSKTLQVSAPPSQSVGLSTDVHNSVDIALSTTDPSCPSDRFRRAMPPCLSVAPVLTTLPASPAQCLSHRFTGNDDAHHGADASLSRAPAGAPLSAVHSPHQSLSSYQVSRQTCLATTFGRYSCLALRMEWAASFLVSVSRETGRGGRLHRARGLRRRRTPRFTGS